MDNLIPNNKPPIDRFFINFTGFVSLIKEILDKCHSKGCTIVHPFITNLGVQHVKRYDKETVINNFIEQSYPFWDQIRNREEVFFHKNVGMVFKGINMNDVSAFSRLFSAKDRDGNLIVDEDDRESIWIFMESFIKISLDHIHIKRAPDVKILDEIDPKTGKNKRMAVYLERYMEEIPNPYHKDNNTKPKTLNIDLNEQCKIWGVQRKFVRRN